MEIENAKIVSTSLGTEDHGIFTFWLNLEGDGWGVGFGGYALDGFDEIKNTRVLQPIGAAAIQEVLRVVGVSIWEELPGNYVRVVTDGPGGKVTRIGNLIEDKWLDVDEFFKGE